MDWSSTPRQTKLLNDLLVREVVNMGAYHNIPLTKDFFLGAFFTVARGHSRE